MRLYWQGVRVLEVTGYWSDGAALFMARFTLEGDDGPTWGFTDELVAS